MGHKAAATAQFQLDDLGLSCLAKSTWGLGAGSDAAELGSELSVSDLELAGWDWAISGIDFGVKKVCIITIWGSFLSNSHQQRSH